MNELQQNLQSLDKVCEGDFPREEIHNIKEHFAEAKPYLYESLDNAKEILKITDYDEYLSKNLHFFAIYLLAEMKDKESFSHIINTVSMDSNALDTLYSDVITEDLKDILYVTYDGNLSLLLERIEDDSISVYARVSMLQTYLQLYEDGVIPKDDVIFLLRKLIKADEEDIKQHLAWFICECHLIEMLDDLKYLYQNGYIYEMVYGNYDEFIDQMFNYDVKRLCTTSVDTYSRLKTWPMFSSDPIIKKEREEAQRRYRKEINKQKQAANKSSKKIKIGRNDPCPCGSGKKYKKCCMNKPNIDGQIEDDLTRSKALEEYPKLRNNQDDDRIYIDDYYDEESIEIDKLLYLALKNRHDRTIMTYTNDIRKEEVRKRAYLLEAFDKYVDKFNKENLSSNEEYDAKYSIHYDTKTWLKELLDILKNDDVRKEVNKYYRKK